MTHTTTALLAVLALAATLGACNLFFDPSETPLGDRADASPDRDEPNDNLEPDFALEPDDEPCEPITCEARGALCGAMQDRCGGFVDCGRCEEGLNCHLGFCSDRACVRLTCEDHRASCGQVIDGCGGVLDCGECEAPKRCGAGGALNTCGGAGVVTPPESLCDGQDNNGDGTIDEGCCPEDWALIGEPGEDLRCRSPRFRPATIDDAYAHCVRLRACLGSPGRGACGHQFTDRVNDNARYECILPGGVRNFGGTGLPCTPEGPEGAENCRCFVSTNAIGCRHPYACVARPLAPLAVACENNATCGRDGRCIEGQCVQTELRYCCDTVDCVVGDVCVDHLCISEP